MELARRGHEVQLTADQPETLGGQQLVARLAAASPRVTWGPAPAVAAEPWFAAARKLRHGLEYLRFLDPGFDTSPKLRLRTADRAPRLVRWVGRAGLRRTPLRRLVAAVLRDLERLTPVSGRDLEFLREARPDVLLLTALTYPRAAQIDHQKAARQLGIPVGACIMSWDHLSSKAPLHLVPERVLVWNDVQRQEAIELHPLPPERVVVTGAQCYDQWFGRQPARDRAAFCAELGVDPARPVILYVASAMSPSPSPGEPEVVGMWLDALRASADERLRTASVLIRPHPERASEWAGFPVDGRGPVVVRGRSPLDAAGKSDYFDAIFHSSAVVGVCTTAFLEAAIVGRPVIALRHPAFHIHQDAMRHFRYLLEVEGGVLQAAPTLAEHLRDLSSALREGEGAAGRNAPFLRAFIRPDGLDVPATPRFADAVEAVAAASPAPAPAVPWFGPLLTPLARHLARHGSRGLTRWLLMDAVEARREHAERRRRVDKARARRRRARNPRKQIAALKTRIKRTLGMAADAK